jgi:filamentous hemagglutinin family protein
MNFAAGSLSSLLLIVSFFGSLASAKPALSQPITPAPDGTGTTVTPQGNTFNIQGGSLSRDGANLFHSFQKFGLSSGETANFLTNPDIRNILGRVVGGDASYINGLIQVSGGNSNLFLMNPAGILFGPNSSLNVPASFTATTATGIGFGAGWFNAVGSNNYNILVGTPSAFNFAVLQPGAIVNEGNLTLTSGSSLTLLGGTVINTGTLRSPGGNITIAAVPGDSAVRISQEGHLLSLDIEPAALTGAEVPAVLQPLSLPQLLTGRPDFGHASALSVSETGEVSLTGSGVRIPAEGGIDAGNIDTSSESGDGGAIALNATSDIVTGSLLSYSTGTGNGGEISLNSSAGGIDNGGLSSDSVQGNGGNITLTAAGDIQIGDIRSNSSGTGSGGNISVSSSAGGIDTSNSEYTRLDSSSTRGNGGSLTLTASGTILTGALNSSGLLQGGDIRIASQLSDIINRGFLDTSSKNGTPGTITLNAYTGSISTGNLSGGRNLTISSGGKDDPIGVSADASVTSDADKINTRSGDVTLNAHNDITVSEPIKTSSVSNLALNAGRSININADIDTSGGNGNITLRGNNNGANLNYRDKGAGSVTMAPGTTLNAGSGNIVIQLGTLPQVGNITLSNINTTGSLIVNAATGNILRSSPDSLITAGRALFQTETSGTGGIGLPAEPLRISVSNLEASSGSGGAFFDSPKGGLTVGGATNIPIGIATSGGSDVSVSAAGDIQIVEGVSTASTSAADAGNIIFNSIGGAIDTSAVALNSSAAQGNGGSVTLTASGDIKTGNILSSSAGTGSGGNIALTSSAGSIDTPSALLSSSSSQGNAGSVTLTASGDIKTFTIWSFSSTGSGGNIALTSSAGGIDIDTTSGGLSSDSGKGNGGSLTLTASRDIKTGNIWSSSGGTGSGGNIALNSSAGGIDTASGSLSSSSLLGNAGSVTLMASGDIKTGDIESYSNGTGSGGNIALNSSAGGIDTALGQLSSSSNQGNAGSVTLTASGDIKTGQIESMAGFRRGWVFDGTALQRKLTPVSGSTGTGGNITIESSRGGVDTSTGALNTMSSGGAAGNVTINAAGHVEIRDIGSDGLSQGGNLSIRSDSLNSINVGGNLDTRSTNGTAGNITLSSPGRITLTGGITSYGTTKSGDITVRSESNNVTTNSITTQSGNGPAGNITVNGNNIAAGNLDSIGRTGAGNIEVRAGNSVTTLNIQSRTDEGNSGNIEVIAPANINTGDQTTSTGEGDAGNITNTAGSDVTAGNQTASSANGNSGDITNSAGGNVTAGNQTASATNGNTGNITNTASGNITAGNQTASATNGNSGNIDNSAGGNITIGNQTTSATNGNSGNITNTAGGNVTAGNQTTSATNGNSGNITNTAGGNVTAGNQTTSATNGNSGNITNTAGGNITTGNQTTSAIGGTAGNITNTAAGQINTGNLTSTGTNGSGDITLTSASGSINTGQVRTDTGTVRIQVSSDSSINPNISSRPTPTPDNNNTTFSNSAQQILTSLNVSSSSPLAVNSAEAIAQLEQSRGREFANYFGSDISNQLTSTESIREALSTIASQTGYRSAIIYVTALSDQLELVVFSPEGQPIRKTVPAASHEELLKVVADFRNKVTNPIYRHSTSYLQPAQQLYQWLIAPIEPELQAAKIDTLLFSMDAGLRSLPVAALHDGKQFLVEKYSLALIPSVSLMDTRYQPIQGKQVLAMGASEFTEKQPLPAVPVELSEITQTLWQGKAFLNQDFTRKNLIGERYNYPYPMIHLATHGEFQPGDIRNSYIQLWNDKLRLDELRNLRLNNPPVELLVLSACRTAIGDEQAELGFAGFAVAAGVKTAVASLWYVSDAGTLGLMTEFYSHLSDAKIKAEALRQAQLAMIRGDVRIEGGELRNSKSRAGVALPAELLKEGTHNLKHPYYWSGFTMIGSPW